ncbi:hypothetical protein [Pigmentibacter ruber]|uniref:hypothetical protein n=1 Tax=Pigmentibacter ruber TaxID=2683196 RepID=UPI00131EA7EB|nr:hypothetical protein [Pigmentibacter ruber]
MFQKKLEEKYAHYLGDEFNKEIVLNYKQTTAMRYINHSYEPNLKLQKKKLNKDFFYAYYCKDIN